MLDNNQQTYAAPGIVRYYRQLQQLQPAEQMLLERLSDRLPQYNMLDLGIGGGRTTQHFAPRVKTYVGIDCSAAMIAACQQRFPTRPPTVRLAVGDARSLPQFAAQTFDLILFSFNGIDYASPGDRLQILQEMHRLAKPGGYVCFSSHNLQGIARQFSLRQQLRLNPLATYTNVAMAVLLRLANPSVSRQQLATAAALTLRDESHTFRLQTHYIRPQAQIAQLQPQFSNIEVYSWRSGRQLAEAEWSVNTDLWLYYLCQRSERA